MKDGGTGSVCCTRNEDTEARQEVPGETCAHGKTSIGWYKDPASFHRAGCSQDFELADYAQQPPPHPDPSQLTAPTPVPTVLGLHPCPGTHHTVSIGPLSPQESDLLEEGTVTHLLNPQNFA